MQTINLTEQTIIICLHLQQHKKTRRKFILVDAALSFLTLIYIFWFAQSNVWFSIVVLLMILSFNGYAQYAYRQIDVKHKTVKLSAAWSSKWAITRFFICLFEWSIYFTYLCVIGPSVFLHHWLLFAIGICVISVAYYELEKLEHEIGIYSLVVDTNIQITLALKKATINV